MQTLKEHTLLKTFHPKSFPDGLSVEAGSLWLHSHAIRDIAEEFLTPLYVLDEATITNTVNQFKKAFSHYPKPVTFLYASKANTSKGLFKHLASLGMGFDVVSGGELYTALQAGVNPQKIELNGNNKSSQELEEAILAGIHLISVDHESELITIDAICQKHNKKANILLRITPGIECHTHDYIKTGSVDSKFGIPLKALSKTIKLILDNYSQTISLKGLHAHIGSQIFEVASFVDLAELMLNLYNNIRLEFDLTFTHLNLGGGYGIAYTQHDDPPEIDTIGQKLVTKLTDVAHSLDYPLPELLLEPGRSIVARAGFTLYEVGVVKHIAEINKIYVSVNGGMGDNIRPALYGSKYSAFVVNKINEPHTKTVTISGKYCESGDVLFQTLTVPESIEAGDLLMVLDTGAYNWAMSSQYNRVPRPATVMVAENGDPRLIVRRETYAEIAQLDV